MKKWQLFTSLFQFAVGLAAIAACIAISASGEPLGRWTVTLILAVLFVVMGIVGLIEAKRK
ncbi:MAG: hypothetical protein J6V07_00585 [Clostridia bacterium]|nr:hypothetical protein [Clostridia bacterium]